MKNDLIPREHHVLRYVAANRCIKVDGVIVGAFPKAFALRPKEADLSVTWLEHFEGQAAEQITKAIWSFRISYFTDPAKGTGEKAAFAKGNVGGTIDAALKYGAKIRIVHFPSKNAPGHSSIRKLPRDNADLRATLATQAFTQMIPNDSIPPKP